MPSKIAKLCFIGLFILLITFKFSTVSKTRTIAYRYEQYNHTGIRRSGKQLLFPFLGLLCGFFFFFFSFIRQNAALLGVPPEETRPICPSVRHCDRHAHVHAQCARCMCVCVFISMFTYTYK